VPHDRSDQAPIAITGLGAVSPIGVGVPAFTRALRAGTSGVRAIEIDPAHRSWVRSTAAATCAGFDPDVIMSPIDQRRLPRMVPMALCAAIEAMRHAELDFLIPRPGEPSSRSHEVSERIALVLGTGAGGIDFTLEQARVGNGPGAQGPEPPPISLWTITNATHGNLAGELSIRLGLRGPSLCISTGCASSSDALGHAMGLLRSDAPGAPDIAVVVGADAHIRWEVLKGMELLRVISVRDLGADGEDIATASRPFDATRDGFILGEGAWALVVERASCAARREVRPIAHALGYAATCDAFHRVRPAPDMTESVRAIHLALEDGGLAPRDVDAVQYHGTATQLNDRLETIAIRRAFGAHADRLIGSSIKGMIGHPQGACGAAAAVATIASLANLDGDPSGPFIPPTINLHHPDPVCDLDYTPNRARPTQARTALVNCLAFGAKNSALIVRTTEGT